MANTIRVTSDYREALCKEFSLDYSLLGEVYSRKLLWQRKLMIEADELGLYQRICKDVANMIISTPVRITTPNQVLNGLIEKEIYGRLKFNSNFSRYLPYFLGIGDGLLVTYIDSIDNKPAINYIPIYNVIPISFNNHSITKLVWFSITKIDDKEYMIATVEELTKREIKIYEVMGSKLSLIDVGGPIWVKILGTSLNTPIFYNNENSLHPKFAWVSTGMFNSRWMDTPFHNSLIWNIELIDKVAQSYNLMEAEYKNSMKKIFISPELVQQCPIDMFDSLSKMPQRIKKFDPSSSLFEVMDVGKDIIKEWNPIIRFTEFNMKLDMELKTLGMSIGLGSEFYSLTYNKVEQTATQVILNHRDAFNTVNVIKHNLIPAIQTTVYGLIDYWIALGWVDEKERPESLYDIGVEFDDGVFINKAAKINEGVLLYKEKLIDKYTFLTRYCNYSKADATNIMTLKKEEEIEEIKFQMEVSQAIGNNQGEQQ